VESRGGSLTGAAVTTPSLREAKSNRLLAVLPRAALEQIIPDLELRPLAMRQVLQPRGEPLEEVVFPLLGVASMISMGDSGDSVEVATIGCEGMVGLPLFLGGAKAAVEVFVQVPGEGLHLPAAAFRGHLEKDPSLARILLLYTQALLTQVAQCSACNCHHDLEARCARWLLQTHDRVKGDTFPLTHDFLGLMLGVRRASVTDTAGALQKRKLIRYSRGAITVLNRKGLEAAACECYRLISDEFDRLLGSVRRRAAAS
jgi:CRP-like cAMP-binding protein